MCGFLASGAERFLHIGGVNHAIAELKQHVSGVFAHPLIVLHQQDHFTRLGARYGLTRLLPCRQERH